MTPRDPHSALRGAIVGLHARLQAVNLQHATNGHQLAQTHWEAAHMPGTSSGEGGRGPDVSDPTFIASLRLKPPDPAVVIRQTWEAIDALRAYTNQLERWATDGNPDPRQRPENGSPCRGGVTHQPDPKGLRCNLKACGKAWPCNPDQPLHWFEPCQGILTPEAGQCPRCELRRGNWVCADCPEGGDVHDHNTRSYLGLCRPHYDRRRNTVE